MSERLACPSDMSGEPRALIERLAPEALPGGRPPKYERREIVNAILSVLRARCAWRMLPHDLPPRENPPPLAPASSPGRKTALGS